MYIQWECFLFCNKWATKLNGMVQIAWPSYEGLEPSPGWLMKQDSWTPFARHMTCIVIFFFSSIRKPGIELGLSRNLRLHTHTYIDTHTHTYTQTLTHTHIDTHTHTHTYTHIDTHTHTYTYIDTHTHTYTHIDTHTHIHTHTHRHSHTHTHTHSM